MKLWLICEFGSGFGDRYAGSNVPLLTGKPANNRSVIDMVLIMCVYLQVSISAGHRGLF